jgi:hypothetical protein
MEGGAVGHIFERDPPKDHPSNGQLKFHPPFSIFSLAAILVGSRDHRTQFWKGAIPPKLVQIGPVASEELIKM